MKISSNIKRLWTKSMVINLFLLTTIAVKRVLDISYSKLMQNTFSSCGRNFKCRLGCHFRFNKNITLGKNVFLGSKVYFDSETADSCFLHLHDNVQINDGVKIDFSGGVTICENALISSDVIIYSHSHGYNPRSQPVLSELYIDKNVWIGSRVLVQSSVNTIGEGSIIASGSVLTKCVEPYSIYAGNPAKKIKDLK